jgi:hypothetical protein
MNETYNNLVGNTPQELQNRGIYGALLNAFTQGFLRNPKPAFIVRNTPAYAAYIAGKETAKPRKLFKAKVYPLIDGRKQMPPVFTWEKTQAYSSKQARFQLYEIFPRGKYFVDPPIPFVDTGINLT